MGVEGCYKIMKYTLMIFNVLVLIVGAVAIGLGVWALVSDYGGDKIKDLTGSELYRGACIAVIVGGCIIVLLSGLGCLGACMENRVLLGLYFVLMLLLLILFVVAAALGFVYRDDIRDELEKEMTDSLLNKYRVNVDETSSNFDDDNKAVTDVWDEIQENLDCCGVSGGLNSTQSWYLWQSSMFFKNQGGLSPNLVPASCCTSEADPLTLCQKRNTDNSKPPQTNITFQFVTTESEYLYSQGCIDALEDKIEDHIIAIAGIAVAVLVIMFLTILFAVCVCTQIGRNSMVV